MVCLLLFFYNSSGKIGANLIRFAQPQADGPRRGRERFQQETTCDHHL